MDTSPDPDYTLKKRVEELVSSPPPDSRVLFFDEKWTTRVKPHGGVSWQRQGRPHRVAAKYRGGGKAELFASLDAHSGGVRVECFRRRRTREMQHFLQQGRRLHRGQDLFVVLDNFGAHRSRGLRRWLAQQKGPSQLHLVYLPVQAPWLNRVELFFRISNEIC